MNIWEEYIKWLNNPQGYSWWDYYNLFVAKRWHRESKQRNYQRNNDIIYHSVSAKRNSNDVKYELISVEDGDYFLEDNILFYKNIDKGYNSNLFIDRIKPFSFITMKVDDEMNLTAEIPNMILDSKFEIDNNGNLILIYG